MIIRLLGLILFVWQPLSFASEAAITLPSLGMRGLAAILELATHGVVAAISVAAGMALWRARPHGRALASIALAGSAAADVQRLYWSVLPSQTMPGDELPLALFSILHSLAWLTYLWWRHRRPGGENGGEEGNGEEHPAASFSVASLPLPHLRAPASSAAASSTSRMNSAR